MNFPRRIVGDHDVDRLQVEAWQHVEPRSTNHPFGLIPVFWNQNDKRRANNGKSGPIGRSNRKTSMWMSGSGQGPPARHTQTSTRHKPRSPEIQFQKQQELPLKLPSGDQSEVEPPGPIPNPEVKRLSANGSGTTGPVRVGRRQVFARIQPTLGPGSFFVRVGGVPESRIISLEEGHFPCLIGIRQ